MHVAFRLASWLVAVVAFWMLLWSPVVLGQTAGQPAAAAVESGERVLGDPAAPVTIIEYASLTCPHCADFHEQTLPGLRERYIDPGKVRLVYRDFPLDQRALDAAAVAHCADPADYFKFLGALFKNQASWANAQDHVAALVTLAKLGGLPEERVRACLADQALLDGILQDRLAGQNEHNVRSTPSFVIDGETYAGNRSVDDFAAIIEPLLPEG